MRKQVPVFTIATVICISLICSCVGKASSANQQLPVGDTENSSLKTKPISENTSDLCVEWERTRSNLNELEKADFEKNGIEFPVSQTNAESGYLLSESIVKDCESRIKIGRLMWNLVRNKEDDTDRKYAHENSTFIISIILKIWDNPGFSRDGVRLDKYNLLNNEIFTAEDNLLLLSYLLKKKTLNIGLVNSILKSPMRSLAPLLSDRLKGAERSGDLTERVYFSILLEQTAKNGNGLRKLTKFANDERLSDQSRRIIRSITEKFKKGHSIVFEDIENLGLEISEHEEDRVSQ